MAGLVFAGMRITVSLVLNLVANGMTADAIIAEYPDLESADIREAYSTPPLSPAKKYTRSPSDIRENSLRFSPNVTLTLTSVLSLSSKKPDIEFAASQFRD